MSEIDKETKRIIQAGALGRSDVYRRLLEYLAEATRSGALPKEVDIAADVLGRTEFDPSMDSTVRVYVHNLRQKLDAWYEDSDPDARRRLAIPRGKYQLSMVDTLADGHAATSIGLSRLLPASAVVALVVAAFLLGRALPIAPTALGSPYAEAPAWHAILDDDRPVVVVVGDYFMFAEGSDVLPGNRLIRDFGVNSSDDFKAWIGTDPALAERYFDIRLSYLPLGIASALNDVLRPLHRDSRTVRIIPQSEFRAPMMRTQHVVYIGYVSGLGSLAQYLFGVSRLAMGASYDELVDIESGDRYESSAGLVLDADSRYVDYGFASTFPGPSGNQFLFVTGLRDEGLMRMAATLGNPATAADVGARLTQAGNAVPTAFEVLYRVSGIDRTHVAATRQFEAPIDADGIWME